MSDSVKFIFKTLIKIPCMILVAYFIFNIFAFTLTYFKLLGFSYVVMQTAVENNYIPPQEEITLRNYLASISNTGVIDNATLILPANNVKVQYGTPITVGVQAHYRFIWPLMPKEQLKDNDDEFIGYGSQSNNDFNGFADGATLEARRQEYENNDANNIVIIYTVPGLKYYPDLN